MTASHTWWVVLLLLIPAVTTLRYDPDQVGFNLNENETATDPLDYWGEWANHSYTPSPDNWRMPFYTLFLDRFVNGDPANDDANGTQFEHDLMSNQLRHGGDVLGLMDSFDYIQGMGMQAIYIAGMPHINQPWASDGFSPLDLTLLDYHFGNIDDWRTMISEAHRRGIYVVLENTMATMGDLIGFPGFLNTSSPLYPEEHDFIWKNSRRYHDFQPSNTLLDQCDYPRFWDDLGYNVTQTTLGPGCRDSEFDQYGEVASFGNYPEWQRQVSKFAFVQDRLREWRSDVRLKIERFSCITIAMLDIDGFRIDKALQVTLDAQGEWSDAMRQCAHRFGKNNFYIPGEMVSGNSFAALYVSRGRQIGQAVDNMTEAVMMTNETSDLGHIRPLEKAAIDAAAFHYSVYRALTRFLGMDGTFEAEGDPPTNFVDLWNGLVQTNDMLNANTGQFDPRHLYGTSNQDVFRWPSITNGTEKQILGLYIVTFLFPGGPLLTWGEEQAFYVLENTNANYVFGRSPMSSSLAWQLHGCYRVGSVKYANFPVDAAANGCFDDNISLDHRDPTHPIRGLLKLMFGMRKNFPVLNDGFYLEQLSNKTHDIYLPGSNGTRTETGLWSVLRDRFTPLQNFTGNAGNQAVWLVYQNDNQSITYQFNCSDEKEGLISPFPAGTTVKNILPPYEEYTLEPSSTKLGIDGSTTSNGCLSQFQLAAWGFKAFVPKDKYAAPLPFITKFVPGHDWRILSTITTGERIKVAFQFSEEMDCDSITNSLSINSTALGNQTAQLDKSTITCSTIPEMDTATWVGAMTSVYNYSIELTNVFHGIHELVVNNVSNKNGNRSTNSVDHFLLRIGSMDNPIVWPKEANYSTSLLSEDPSKNGTLWVSHKAAGADLWRYTLDFGSSYSNWMPYAGGNNSIPPKNWTGADSQAWDGEHIMVQYWSRIAGSSDHFQHGDVGRDNLPPRRYPHFWIQGTFNQFGFDEGYANQMQQDTNDGLWKINFMSEWPAQLSLNAWGINPDGQPDQTQIFGDIDGDYVLDRIAPQSLVPNVLNITDVPPSPFLSYTLAMNDGSLRFSLTPTGSRWTQLVLYLFLGLIPPASGAAAAWIYLKAFYQIKFNQMGISNKRSWFPFSFSRPFMRLDDDRSGDVNVGQTSSLLPPVANLIARVVDRSSRSASIENVSALNESGSPTRRTVLIATMEYDIEDWAIKIKIGGLGVMAQLMGKNLSHQNLIWVVPCVGGVDYPVDQRAEPMDVVVLGNTYQIQVQYHVLRNITYVLLDAPVFRSQTKSDPYPPRMDDLESAIYYSAWNSCIAETIKRFPVDIYHINDYHGAIAPLHLLPRTIPCCLSLHNAEFQGLWPMRTPQERDEVCWIFNLDPAVVQKYVQFGEVFNLLHAGASYLHIHQKGFGAVGVSKKYGKRSYARYPIFWKLKEIGALPNPDPSDTADWTRGESTGEAYIDPNFEAARGALRVQAQDWAGLERNPDAELFVFVGRWSMQKGVDLIADVFPSVLDEYPNVQLICVGPIIDLYGKFASIKLEKLMHLYPGRVFSKPEFTALPPFIFTGAEFALIPSRDEPFGLVAVEFGRKGALGVGARVGGLGQMPGWWFTIESMTTKHLTHQFKTAIHDALSSKKDVRAIMRARSGKQRFPVAQWVQDLETLQSTAIARHKKYAERGKRLSVATPAPSEMPSTNLHASRIINYGSQPENAGDISRRFGSRKGPGRARNTLRKNRNSQGGGATPVIEEDSSEEETDIYALYGETPGSGSQTPAYRNDRGAQFGIGPEDDDDQMTSLASLRERFATEQAEASPLQSGMATPTGHGVQDGLLNPPLSSRNRNSAISLLSVEGVVGEKQDFNLQKVSPFFTDSTGEYANTYAKGLGNLNGKNSEDLFSIEEYISKSEKEWFSRYREAKLGRSPLGGTPASSVFRLKMHNSPPDSPTRSNSPMRGDEEFPLWKGYVPPSGLKRFLLIRIKDWPLYSILLGFGQIIAANSYQITLLNGEIGQPAIKLYIVATIYLISSIIWWLLFRRVKSVYVLSSPFLLYGSAFLFLGMSPFVAAGDGRMWMQNIATGFYAFASSSGSIFFALNFGDEGGAPIASWVYRACIIQGTQQIYVTALWYWGTSMAIQTQAGTTQVSLVDSNPGLLTGIGVFVAVLMWGVGAMIYYGLPDYYRQAPGKVPAFYKSLFHRKIIVWFFYAVLVQNYWLSAPYGRNWLYLWSSQHAATWQIILLVILFFIGVWAVLLWCFSMLSVYHAWILPIFAIGLGAPRWCQMLWATSNIGSYLPWAGNPVSSALTGRVLWLWLGVLDTIQGVGFGMILLNTLTRFHIAFTLLAAQVLGSIATILGRATAPDKIGPGDVFPDFSAGIALGLSKSWFWVCLLFQLSICFVCFIYFRKEQLQKP